MRFQKDGPKRRRRTRRELPSGQVRRWPKGPGYYTPGPEREVKRLAPATDEPPSRGRPRRTRGALAVYLAEQKGEVWVEVERRGNLRRVRAYGATAYARGGTR